jgi:hypothetical protein
VPGVRWAVFLFSRLHLSHHSLLKTHPTSTRRSSHSFLARHTQPQSPSHTTKTHALQHWGVGSFLLGGRPSGPRLGPISSIHVASLHKLILLRHSESWNVFLILNIRFLPYTSHTFCLHRPLKTQRTIIDDAWCATTGHDTSSPTTRQYLFIASIPRDLRLTHRYSRKQDSLHAAL